MVSQSATVNIADLRGENRRMRTYSIEAIVPSMKNCLGSSFHSRSGTQANLMKSTPSQEISEYFFKRPNGDRSIHRKVRFAKLDAVYLYEPDNGRKQDMWWSQNELNQYRVEERISSRGRSEQIYLRTYNGAFRELCSTRAISTTMKRNLILGSALGFRGLEKTVSKECIYTRRLDRRCIVASVLTLQYSLRTQNPTSAAIIDETNIIIASHSEVLTRSHRMWSAVIGEMDQIAVKFDC